MLSSRVDRGAPELGLELRSRTGRLALAGTVAASAMASLDATVVNVAAPHIGHDLHAGLTGLQWVLTGYLLTLASLILLGGALGDRYGRRKVFVIGTVWFALASLLCGAAPNIEVLIAARMVQGVGAALLTPGSLAILQASFRQSDRAAAVGAWSGFGGVAGAIGPFVGGWLVDGPGWRWGFLINLPVAAAVLACTYAAIPESRDPRPPARFDLRGAALAAATLGAATWALTESSSRGWSDPTVSGGAVVAVLAAVLFVRRMTRTEDPLVSPSLFASRAFTVTNIATVLLYAALGVTFFLVAFELQVAAGWSALRAGTALLPATALMFLLSARSGSLAKRIGPRAQLTVGPVLVGGGLLLLTRVSADASWLRDLLPGSVMLGLGLVSFVAPLTATVMGSVSDEHVSTASGVNNAVARTSTLAALAVIPAVSGLSAAAGASAVTQGYRHALMIAATLALLAAPVSYIGLRRNEPERSSPRHYHCSLDGPPVQPDPARCPEVSVGASSS